MATVEYPLKVVYCPNCGYPPEFCEWGGKYDSCKPWLQANYPHLLPAAAGAAAAVPAAKGSDSATDAVTQKLANTTISAAPADSAAEPAKPVKKAKEPPRPKVFVEVKEQGKRRKITCVTGLEAFCPDMKLKEIASAIGKKFGAGASVGKSATNVPQIDIQGDVAYDLPELLGKLYGIKEQDVDVRGLED